MIIKIVVLVAVVVYPNILKVDYINLIQIENFCAGKNIYKFFQIPSIALKVSIQFKVLNLLRTTQLAIILFRYYLKK
jgi:hypothetical protein